MQIPITNCSEKVEWKLSTLPNVMGNYVAIKLHWTHHRIMSILSIWNYDGSDFGMRIGAANRLFNAQLLLCIMGSWPCVMHVRFHKLCLQHDVEKRRRRKKGKKSSVFKSGTRSDRIRITVCAIHLTLQSKNDWNFRYRKWYNLTLFFKIEPKAEKKTVFPILSRTIHVFLFFFCFVQQRQRQQWHWSKCLDSNHRTLTTDIIFPQTDLSY